MKASGACLLLLAACTSEPVKTREAPAPAASATSERHFGGPFKSESEPIQVAELLRDPTPYLTKTVKCEGIVAQVCQAAGCWLELRASAQASEGLRVPMAGHSFFVPRDVVGRPAIVEGTLTARDLGQAELDHLQGEGLKAIGPLSLAATGVVVR